LESGLLINNIGNRETLNLSEQQIIDCDPGTSNTGCNGKSLTNLNLLLNNIKINWFL
jgi:hypothetical protein